MRQMTRSLTFRLTLAFVLVGLVGAILVALLVNVRTRSEFDRFLLTRDQATLVTALEAYYTTHGGWDGVADMVHSTSPLDEYSREIVLVNSDHVVLLGNRQYAPGQVVPEVAFKDGVPVSVNGQTVGFVLPAGRDGAPPGGRDGAPPRPSPGPPPDVLFLQQVGWAAAISAAVATLIALILGGLLARNLTGPLRELTAATQVMAGGRFDERVSVRSDDEIGELARSFNQMSADLERSSQLRKQMTADLAHDLRTPLTILRGYTEGLQDGRLAGSPGLYATMHGEVQHLGRLVDDLRVLSLADAGELPLNRRPVDPRALLERTGLAYFDRAGQQGVALRVEAAEDLPSIFVDTDRMTQVLNNLVSNALSHTSAGEIVLAGGHDGGRVWLSVRDTGGGIAPADLPFIFDRLYRGDRSRHRNGDSSSGLGLAIAKAIVEAHGGAIAAESAPGQGATFTISLSVYRPDAGEAGPRRGGRQAAGAG